MPGKEHSDRCDELYHAAFKYAKFCNIIFRLLAQSIRNLHLSSFIHHNYHESILSTVT